MPFDEKQGERRVVSVMFVDLVGYTGRAEALDVEDVEALLEPYHALVRQEVENRGGVIAKFAGDGAMALFGVPTAHEDDPERAVRSALAIRDALDELARDGDRVSVRVGVTSGEALVTFAGQSVDALGDVVNTAARLEAGAPSNGVLVDDFTWRACERAIEFDRAPSVEAKGKTTAVGAWRAMSVRSAIPEQPREHVALVGRRAEAAILHEVLDRSCSERSAQMATLVGEPGIGKTRLVEELRSTVGNSTDSVVWRRGRSLAYGHGIALWALGEIVKQEAGILESDDIETAERKLDATVAAIVVDQDARPWLVRHLRPLIGVPADVGLGADSRYESFAAWRHFLEAIAERTPCVLVFEDVHWADDTLLDFIDHLADRAGGVPILILCTTRPELFERRPGWAGGKTNAYTVLLQPLTEDEIAVLIGRLLRTGSVPEQLQRQMLEPIAGNPLYAQEFVRMLQDRDALVLAGDGWTLRSMPPGMPESVQGVIAARLDTLSLGEKSFIQAASVIGRTAWIGAVCSLTQQTAVQAEEVLHQLVRKQLLRPARRSSIHGEAEFQFGHALTKDVAYAQIRRGDRAKQHEQAAAWIEHMAGQRDDKAELLASHYQQALVLRQALGESIDDLQPRALSALIEAGRQAAQSSAHSAATRHYEAALDLAPEGYESMRAVALRGLATAAINQSEVDPGLLDEAVSAQTAVEDWEAAADLEWRCSFWYEQHAGSGDEAQEHLARAAEYASRSPLTTTGCLIAAQQSRRLINSGQPSPVLELTERLIPDAKRGGLVAGHAILVGWRGLARFELGDDAGFDDLRNAAATLAAQAHERTCVVHINLGNTLRGHGDMRGARLAFDEAARWADRFSSAFLIDWAAGERAYQAYHAGEWTAADDLLSHVGQYGAFAENGVRLVGGRIALGRDQLDIALAHAHPLIAYSANTGDDQSLYYGQALAARGYYAAGRTAEADDSCDRILARWTETSGLAGAIELCEITYILASRGRFQDIAHAASVLPGTCRWREAMTLTAGQNYADAATLYQELGSAPLAADANLLAARKATSDGRRADARKHCQAVRAFADETGATLYQRQAVTDTV